MQTTPQPTKREHKLFVLQLWRDTPTDPWRLAIQPADDPKPLGLPNGAALQAYIETMMQPKPSS